MLTKIFPNEDDDDDDDDDDSKKSFEANDVFI